MTRSEKAEQIKLLIGINEIADFENTMSYHYDLHNKKVVKSIILEIEDKGIVYSGHQEVQKMVTNNGAELLENIFIFNPSN